MKLMELNFRAPHLDEAFARPQGVLLKCIHLITDFSKVLKTAISSFSDFFSITNPLGLCSYGVPMGILKSG